MPRTIAEGDPSAHRRRSLATGSRSAARRFGGDAAPGAGESVAHTLIVSESSGVHAMRPSRTKAPGAGPDGGNPRGGA
jgi:hypothetical protein